MGSAWIIAALASALGMGVGGGLAWLMKGIQERFVLIYSLCAGILLGLLFFEMIPESIEMGGWLVFIAGVTAGALLFKFVHFSMNKVIIITDSRQKDIFMYTGVILTVSIAIHNFPMGIAIGKTIGTDIGDFMLLSLLLHNIPEGIIVLTPLFLVGFRFFTALFCTTIITIPIAVGALIGQYVGMHIPYFLAFIVNITISIIFLVTVREIFGQAIKQSSILYASSVGLLGFVLIYGYIRIV